MTKYTLKQAATLMNKSERTARRWVTDGKLPATLTQRGPRGIWMIEEEDLLAFLPPDAKASYQEVTRETKRLRHEFKYFVTRAEAGTLTDGDFKRARGALCEGE